MEDVPSLGGISAVACLHCDDGGSLDSRLPSSRAPRLTEGPLCVACFWGREGLPKRQDADVAQW